MPAIATRLTERNVVQASLALMAALALVLISTAGTAFAGATEITLIDGNLPKASLRFSCDEEDHGISMDLENPPTPFLNEEEIIGVFDAGSPDAFSLHGFTVSMSDTHTRLFLDPDYRTAVEDALAVLVKDGEHNLTIFAPKASMQIRWPLGADLVASVATRYRKSCK